MSKKYLYRIMHVDQQKYTNTWKELELSLLQSWQWGEIKSGELFYVSIFKSRFGGSYFEFLPQQTIVFDQLGYKIYKFGESLNKTKLKLRKIF